LALYDGWQRRRHRDLRDLALATRAAMAEDSKAIDQALPAPKPLIGVQDDEFDRSKWW
jgi:hypothetical protein